MGKKAKRRAKKKHLQQAQRHRQPQQEPQEHRAQERTAQAQSVDTSAAPVALASSDEHSQQVSPPDAAPTKPFDPYALPPFSPNYWQMVGLAVFCGVLIALSFSPVQFFPLALLGITGLFWLVAIQPNKRRSFAVMWWGTSAMTALHLWWLAVFVGNIFGAPPLGALSLLLFALEGSFYGLMALVVALLFRSTGAKLWGLAVGWVLVEWLRMLGPLAFPWPTLGYALLDTQIIQIADIGGVLLCSVLLAATAAALLSWYTAKTKAPQWIMLFWWLVALGYGATRTPAQGPVQPMYTLRTSFDAFGRASGQLSPQQQLEEQLRVSQQRQSGELLVWSESALSSASLPQQVGPSFPAAGITGLGVYSPSQNVAIAVDGAGQVTSVNHKARLVPFGEFFIFYDGILSPIYSLIERQLGFTLPSMQPAKTLTPLQIDGRLYGAYICYDSVFPWVARQLAAKGAQILVNPSNDGWYAGWGVEQHFAMGRVRAIETRRWLVRSVNMGVAGTVNDLGKPIEVLKSGPTAGLHVRPLLLNVQTPFVRYGDGIMFGMLGCLLLLAVWQDRSPRRQQQHFSH